MRAPTLPEQLFAAVSALTVMAGVIVVGVGRLLDPPDVLVIVATVLVFAPLGLWQQSAWKAMRLQHRVLAAYNARLRAAAARRLGNIAASAGAPPLPDVEVNGRPASRPVVKRERSAE